MSIKRLTIEAEHEITLGELKKFISNLGECDFTFNILDTYRHIVFDNDKIRLYDDEEDLLKVTVTRGYEERIIAHEDIACITLQKLNRYAIATFYPIGRLLIFQR